MIELIKKYITESLKNDNAVKLIVLGIIVLIVLLIINNKKSRNKKKKLTQENKINNIQDFQQQNNTLDIKPGIHTERTFKISESQIKGKIGESITAYEFGEFFHNISSRYKILKNIYLKFNDNDTTEIDIIVISEYGIFVVENKNYRGWIFGSFKDNKWTDSYPNGAKYHFYNPLKQNYTHISVLKKYIDEKYHNMIYSYIVFSGECELKKVPYNSEFIKVIKSNQIFDTLKGSLKNKCITADEVETLYNNIKFFAVNSDDVKINHAEKVKLKRGS